MADNFLNLAEALSDRQARANVQAVVDFIGGDPARFGELIRIFDAGDRRTKQCSAWPISVVAERHPELLVPYLAKLLSYLERNDVHNAVKRSVVRLLQFVEVPRRLQGRAFSLCVDLLDDPSEPIAVRCFSMTAAAKIARGKPELMQELKLVAVKQADHASAGLKVRIRRLVTGK